MNEIDKHDRRLTIKELSLDDRPREKLLLKGVDTLSDAELLAILIGSGNRDETAVELSQRILHAVSNNLNELGKLSVKDLIKQFHGVGEAKALAIISALELGRRRKVAEAMIIPQISSSKDIYNMMHPVLRDLKHEEFWVLLLNRSNKVIRKFVANKGGLTQVMVDVRIIMKEALDSLATAMVICHNHPSGGMKPSLEDDLLTSQLKDGGRILEIELLDHLVLTDSGYYSYRDENRL